MSASTVPRDLIACSIGLYYDFVNY